MVQLGSLVVFYWIASARVWFRKVSFLGSENTRFQAPRFWLPIGHRGTDLSHHFGKHPRHLTVDAAPRFQCFGARGNYYSRFFFLLFYLSPNFHNSIRGFITRNFFRNKYDYRDLWMKFSDKSSGSLDIRDLLPKVGDFVAEGCSFDKWPFGYRHRHSETFHLAYCHDAFYAKKGRALHRLASIARAQEIRWQTFCEFPADDAEATRVRLPDRRRESFQRTWY